MRTVPDIAVVEISRLRADGVAVSDDDVVWLATLGARVENPRGSSVEAAGGREALRLSNGTVLRPLTLRADAWLARFGPVFGDEADLYAVAYAMAHPAGLLVLETSARAVVEAVGTWAESLAVTRRELAGAVDRLTGSDDPRDPNAKAPTTEDVVSLLVAATGIPASHWEERTWAEIDAVHSGVYRWASMLSLAGGDPNAAESKAALRRFALAINEIRKRSEANGKEGN